MKKRHLKRYLIILTSGLLICALAKPIVKACAGGDYFEVFDSFFAPEVSNNEESKPFFSSVLTFYDGYYGYFMEGSSEQFDSVNIDEWSTFFDNKVTRKDLKYLLYEANLGQIDTLIFHIKDPKYPINKGLKKNSLISYSDKAESREFLFLLGFAKRCSAVSNRKIQWGMEEEPTINVKKTAGELLKGGAKLIKNVKSNFIKERYFFQLARLHFFNENYAECVNYFSQKADSFLLSKSMKYRSMSYAAGAASRLNQKAKANYMFSIVYDQCPELKKTAYLSFAPENEKDWSGALSLSKNDREKAVLWQMIGIKEDPLRALKQIYSIDSKSDLLDVLLVRAINEAESNVITAGYTSSDSIGYKLKIKWLDQELLQFVSSTADKGNTAKPYLWNLSAGYLLTLGGDYKKAESFLAKARKQSKDDVLAQEQIRITEIVAKVEQFVPSEKNEEKLVTELEWLKASESHNPSLRSQNVYTWALHRLAQTYKQTGDPIKASCLDYLITQDILADNILLDKQIAYLDKPSKTAFDKLIVEIYPYKKETLYDMQGINLLYEHKLNEARDKFTKAGSKDLESNPFTIRNIDCRDCDQAEYDNSYNSINFVNEVLALEEKAKSDPKTAFNSYYKLANAYYNMSYFGNSRNLFTNEAHYLGLIYFSYDANDRVKYMRFLDCSKAEENYVKAMNSTINKELKAKCAFMAAKCEQNKYFSTNNINDENSFKAGKYFKILKDQYSTAKYYNEIIKECGYFRTYINKR